MPHATPIGIAVVDFRGCYLVGMRSEDAALPGYAEFPGGKCEPGETLADCACRECREETGVDVTPLELLHSRPFVYPHGTVDLHFWLCRPAEANSVPEPQGGFRWVPKSELNSLRFPEANAPVLQLLATRQVPS